jgi:hypothetical protein
MTHATRFVTAVVLTPLALCAPVQAQTPEIDALRVRAEAGVAEAQLDLGGMYADGLGVPQDDAEAVTHSCGRRVGGSYVNRGGLMSPIVTEAE